VSGRTEQLGRQLRRLRSNAADSDTKGCALAARRAAHLARDLADEDDGLEALVTKGVIDAVIAEKVAGCIERADEEDQDFQIDALLDDGRDLDQFLRSIEHRAPMRELPFTPLVPSTTPASATKTALTISGRHIVVAERAGEGLVFVDERPVGKPFALTSAPTSKADVQRLENGTTRIIWENLTVELAADFASVTIIGA
jgi:hypothetical protein